MDQILPTILKNTYSLQQLKHRFNVLKNSILESFFNTPAQNITAKDLSWLQTFPPSFSKNFTKDNVYEIFNLLDKEITKLKTLVIYLTFEPDDTSLVSIGSYSRKLFGGNLLLDVKFDPNLIAGTALVWNGNYKDYSLRAKIEEKKNAVSDSFKKFLR